MRGQLCPDDLQRLLNAPGAQRYYDTASGNISVIQQVDDVLLRITTASDEFKIISVGPIRPNQVTNGVIARDFTVWTAFASPFGAT